MDPTRVSKMQNKIHPSPQLIQQKFIAVMAISSLLEHLQQRFKTLIPSTTNTEVIPAHNCNEWMHAESKPLQKIDPSPLLVPNKFIPV